MGTCGWVVGRVPEQAPNPNTFSISNELCQGESTKAPSLQIDSLNRETNRRGGRGPAHLEMLTGGRKARTVPRGVAGTSGQRRPQPSIPTRI